MSPVLMTFGLDAEWGLEGLGYTDYTSFDVIAAPVWEEVIRLRQSVVDFGQNQDERIEKLYSYAFQQQGKNFRPVIVLLMARAIAQYMGYP